MRRAARWCARGALVLQLAAACTQDFSAFSFEQPRAAKRREAAGTLDAAVAPVDSGEPPASPSPSPDAAAPQAAAAGMTAKNATERVAANGGSTAAQTDAPSRPAAHVDASDAGQDDAGSPPLALECSASWTELSALGAATPPTAACERCACEACAGLVLECLRGGSTAERGLCRNLLGCALRARCQEYDCYCATPGCNYRASVGDGPCAAQINAAAGGTRNRVNALLGADPLDRSQPLVRATQAIACLYGVDPASPGPTASGACEADCR